MQRQVPTRSSAKAGEGFGGLDADRGNDAFSTALSDEKRSAAASRDQVDTGTDAADDAVSSDEFGDPETPAPVNSAQSDEMLALLAGLKSSAAFSDEADLGAGQDVEADLPDLEPAAEDGVAELAGDEAILSLLSPKAQTTGKLAVKAEANVDEIVVPDKQVAGDTKAQKSTETSTAQADSGKQKAQAAAGSPAVVAPQTPRTANNDVAAATMAPVASLATASSAAAQGVQAPVKSVSANDAPDRQKGSAEAKEALRSLGLAGEATTTRAGAGKAPSGDGLSGGAGRKNDNAAPRLDEQAAVKTGNVDVIESRRFMPAPNLSGNAQALTRSLMDASDAALAAQRTASAQTAAAASQPQSGQMLHTLKLQLNPLSLGNVTAVLKLTGEELSVAIRVETAEAYRQFSDDNQSIVKSLRAQGYAVEQITVQHVAATDRSSGQTPQQGFQAGQQGAASGDAQNSGRESSGSNAGQQGRNQQGGQGNEQNSYTGPGTRNSDGVYL